MLIVAVAPVGLTLFFPGAAANTGALEVAGDTQGSTSVLVSKRYGLGVPDWSQLESGERCSRKLASCLVVGWVTAGDSASLGGVNKRGVRWGDCWSNVFCCFPSLLVSEQRGLDDFSIFMNVETAEVSRDQLIVCERRQCAGVY